MGKDRILKCASGLLAAGGLGKKEGVAGAA